MLLKRLVLTMVAIAMLIALPLTAFAKLDEKDWRAAKGELERALAANDASAIASAIPKVAEDQSARAVDLLVKVGAAVENIQVYEAVKAAFTSMTDREAVDAMLKELKQNSKPGDWQLRAVLCDCLSGVQGDGVTAAIAKQLNDKNPYVISAAAKSLGARRDKEGVQPLIDKLQELEKNKDVVWVDVKQALTSITGQDHADAKEWQFWWDGVKMSFDPSKDRGDKNDSTTSLRPGEESGSFFTEPIVAKRIMFVIDVSGSMEAKDIPVEGKGMQTRMEVVKNELIRAVKGLKKDVKFNIMAFSDKLKSWQKIEKGAGGLMPATDAAKADAIKWVTAMKPEGATHTDDALKKAFEAIDVNQIILLSDGQPAKFTGGQMATPTPTGPILDMVRGLNRLRGVKINTFCFAVFTAMGGAEDLLKFMEDLAKQNGGKLILCGGGGVQRPKQPDPNDPNDPNGGQQQPNN